MVRNTTGILTLMMMIVTIIPGVKRSGREADYSRPSSDEVKNVRSYTSINFI